MYNMNLPTLQYQKTHIITYNNKDYYLHHLSLINCIKNILNGTLSCDFLVTVGTFWSLKFFVVPSVLLLILCFQYWSTVYQVVLDTPRWFSPAFWSLAHSVLSLPLLYGFWAEFL